MNLSKVFSSPMLGLGINLVDTFFVSDKEKRTTRDRLYTLEQEGRTEELEKEVARLQEIVSVDTVDPDTISQANKKSKWTTYMGGMVGGALLLDTILRPLFNWGISVYASMNDTIIPQIPRLDADQLWMVLGMTGITAATSYAKTKASGVVDTVSGIINPHLWKR